MKKSFWIIYVNPNYPKSGDMFTALSRDDLADRFLKGRLANQAPPYGVLYRAVELLVGYSGIGARINQSSQGRSDGEALAFLGIGSGQLRSMQRACARRRLAERRWHRHVYLLRQYIAKLMQE